MDEKIKEIVEKVNEYKANLHEKQERIKIAKKERLEIQINELEKKKKKKNEWLALEKKREENIKKREQERIEDEIKRWEILRGVSS